MGPSRWGLYAGCTTQHHAEAANPMGPPRPSPLQPEPTRPGQHRCPAPSYQFCIGICWVARLLSKDAALVLGGGLSSCSRHSSLHHTSPWLRLPICDVQIKWQCLQQTFPKNGLTKRFLFTSLCPAKESWEGSSDWGAVSPGESTIPFPAPLTRAFKASVPFAGANLSRVILIFFWHR